MPIYQSMFEVKASADRVWHVLTTLEQYGEWNPQIPSASGRIRVGEIIRLRLALPGRPTLDLSATIQEVDPGRLLTWRGHVLAPWFFEGYRKFAIHNIERDRVSVEHVEDVHGVFAPAFSLVMGVPVRRSQRALNEALRHRAEERNSGMRS